jgi:hypothetical protein
MLQEEVELKRGCEAIVRTPNQCATEGFNTIIPSENQAM